MKSMKRSLLLRVVGGAPVAVAPVRLTFGMRGLDELFAAQGSIGIFRELWETRSGGSPDSEPGWAITRQELRDAVIALDAQCAGASYRQTAELIYGLERVKKEWLGSGCALKDEIRRTRARGVRLMMGGYRQFLR